MLRRVLLPSFQAAGAGRDQSVLQAVGPIQASLVQLEKMVGVALLSSHCLVGLCDSLWAVPLDL